MEGVFYGFDTVLDKNSIKVKQNLKVQKVPLWHVMN